MRAGFAIAALAILIAGCDRWASEERKAEAAAAAKTRLEGMKDTCASKLTYARLKEYVFDQAAQVRNTDPRRLDPLAANSVVRMDYPVVKSRDDDLNITVCAGRFVMNLPPGVQEAFGGQSVIRANVQYAAQAAADGSGLVYSMTGAEPIIYRIATLGLPTASGMLPTAAPEPPAAAKAPFETAEATPDPLLTERPVRTATAEPRQEATARPTPEPAAKAVASPSFNCRHARTRSEKMVCGNGSLAAADRQMSATYYGEMARADAATKRALRRTRDSFLAKRDRCTSEACVARAYAERVAEIRRVAGQ